MTDATQPQALPRPLSPRRRRRIERELRALHAMQGHMNTWDIGWALLAIPLLSLLCLAVGYKLHLQSGSGFVGVGASMALGAAIWWIGRRWFLLAYLIVLGLLVVLMEDLPGWVDYPVSDKKGGRREKLEYAIARRKALIRMADTSPS